MLIAYFISQITQTITSLVIFMLSYIFLFLNHPGYSVIHLLPKEIKNNSKIGLQSATYHFNNTLKEQLI